MSSIIVRMAKQSQFYIIDLPFFYRLADCKLRTYAKSNYVGCAMRTLPLKVAGQTVLRRVRNAHLTLKIVRKTNFWRHY